MTKIRSLTNIQKTPGTALVDLLNFSDVVITYRNRKVARLSKYTETPDQPPADVSSLDLRNWTIMLPTGSQGDPDNVYYAKLPDEAKKYVVRDTNGALALRTPVTGVHSPNSKYPRTELREMKDDNWGKAAWSNASGVHTLEARMSVNHNLVAKPEVSILQIHDGSDDVMQIRVGARGKLEVWWDDGNKRYTLDDNFELGTTHDFVIQATNKSIFVYYDGQLEVTIGKSGSGWYFKAGTYLQSTVGHGEKSDAWAETRIHALKVTHY